MRYLVRVSCGSGSKLAVVLRIGNHSLLIDGEVVKKGCDSLGRIIIGGDDPFGIIRMRVLIGVVYWIKYNILYKPINGSLVVWVFNVLILDEIVEIVERRNMYYRHRRRRGIFGAGQFRTKVHNCAI